MAPSISGFSWRDWFPSLRRKQPDGDMLVTTKGLLPASSLERHDLWRVDDQEAAHRIEYYLDGELVRADASVYIRKGESVIPAQASLGG